MVNFVICEDEAEFRNSMKVEIDNFMMNYDDDYHIYTFENYGSEWEKFVKSNESYKIYLLDIVTTNGSGMDAARRIREEFSDYSSMIIVVSGHTEHKFDALAKRLMLVEFINKFDNCKMRLKRALKACMCNYDKRPNALKYEYHKVSYNISQSEIVKIVREPDSKRCLIRTKAEDTYTIDTIKNLEEKLSERFVKCNRNTIINIDQVRSYDIKNNILKLKNGEVINDTTKPNRKDIYDRVRGVY